MVTRAVVTGVTLVRKSIVTNGYFRVGFKLLRKGRKRERHYFWYAEDEMAAYMYTVKTLRKQGFRI